MCRALEPGEQLEEHDPYELLVHLASGGMGAVFLARERHGAVGAPLCAVKRAHRLLLLDPSFREMWLREAALSARIKHPNVVAVREGAARPGELLLVMDYVEGGSLSDLISAQRPLGPFPTAIALRILIDVARGLEAMHKLSVGSSEGGVVHRDVSPANVLVGIDGVARLVDFGVAKVIDAESPVTQKGLLKGKVPFMAPEYLLNGEVSPALDVFAFGAMAWELFVGQRLFRGATDLDTMSQILQPQPPPAAGVGASVDAVIARALLKDPARRFRDAGEIADLLEAAAVQETPAATPRELACYVAELLADRLQARSRLLQRALKRDFGRTVKFQAPRACLPLREQAPEHSGTRFVPSPLRQSDLPKIAIPPAEPDTLVDAVPAPWRLGHQPVAVRRPAGRGGVMVTAVVALSALVVVLSAVWVRGRPDAAGATSFERPPEPPIGRVPALVEILNTPRMGWNAAAPPSRVDEASVAVPKSQEVRKKVTKRDVFVPAGI